MTWVLAVISLVYCPIWASACSLMRNTLNSLLYSLLVVLVWHLQVRQGSYRVGYYVFEVNLFNLEVILGYKLFLFKLEVNVFNLDIILRKIGTNKQEVEQRVLTLLSIMPKPNRN